MITFDITNRFTGAALFTAEIDCAEDAPTSSKLGLAVQWGIKTHANLAGADLADAYLVGANLAGANLARADLAGAYLARANLAGADLAGADLAGADLAGANLAGANLARADLARANLARANLARANLARADLARADLARANLARANLARAKWRNGIVIQRAPLQLYGLDYPVTILDEHMQIGCELHSLSDWAGFDNERIARMDGLRARRFWDAHKDALLALAKSDNRQTAEPATEDAA